MIDYSSGEWKQALQSLVLGTVAGWVIVGIYCLLKYWPWP